MRAEGHILGDPRAACFHARFALEAVVHWLYRHEPDLHLPYDQSLGALLHDPGFQHLLPQTLFQKARVIQKAGNQAVHNPRPVPTLEAMQVVRELHHLCYWLTRTYARIPSLAAAQWQDSRVPRPLRQQDIVPRAELEKLERQLATQNAEHLKRQQEWDALDAELQDLRQQLAALRAASSSRPDPHDYSEAETRRYLIDVDLKRAGWPLDQARDREYPVTGMPNEQGTGFVDYVLWGDDGKPLGLVEAKRTTVDPQSGMHQAKLYADCLEQMHGQRPVIFYTNGYETWCWDDQAYPPRKVAGFFKQDELARLILRRTARLPLTVALIKDSIVVGVSPCSGCETGLPSLPFALRSATTIVPRFAPLRATATSRRAPKGAVGLRHGPTSNGLTAYRMRLHLASAASGLRPSTTPARRPRLRLPGTTDLRFALHGRQRALLSETRPWGDL